MIRKEIISLKSNSLKSFKEEKFKNLINLEYLDISNIGLRVMCKFNYLKKLNFINLQSNQLTAIQPEAFKELKFLKSRTVSN